MSKHSSFVEPVNAVLSDHELLQEYLADVDRIFDSHDPAATQQAVAAVRRFLQYKIITHFAYEEEHILPGLLQASATKKMARQLARLQEEHRALLKQADQLAALLMVHRPGPGTTALRKALMQFFHDFQKHAAFENDIFPALL